MSSDNSTRVAAGGADAE
jgi:plastocyanin